MIATYIPSYQVNKPSGRGIPNKERSPFLIFSEILKRGLFNFWWGFSRLTLARQHVVPDPYPALRLAYKII